MPPPDFEVPAENPPGLITEADFEFEEGRELGIIYRRDNQSLVGYDPERPGLGNVRANINSGNRDAKLVLLWNLCRDLTPEQRSRRMHFIQASNGSSVRRI